MSDELLNHLKDLREQTVRRLRVLEGQAATFGTYAPAYITIEIEDCREKIAVLNEQINNPIKPEDLLAKTPIELFSKANQMRLS